MARLTSRYAVFLCLLLALHEFGPAHFAVVPQGFHSKVVDNVDDDAEDEQSDSEDAQDEQDSEQNHNDDEDNDEEPDQDKTPAEVPKTAVGKPKAFIGKLLSYGSKLFKGIKKGSEILNYATTAASVIQQVVEAISKCCHTKACEYSDQFRQLQTDIKDLSVQADELELQVENAEVFVKDSIARYSEVIGKINDIGDAQLRFLRALSPGIEVSINNASAKAQKYIDNLKGKGKAASAAKIARLYRTAIENAVAITTPLLGLAMPLAEKLYESAKERVAGRKTAQLTRKNAIRVKKPPRGTKVTGKLRRKFGGYVGSTRRMNKFVKKTKTRSQKVKSFAKIVGKGFITAFNLATAGLTIYGMVVTAQSCHKKADQAKRARDELQKTKTMFEEGIRNLTESQNEIKAAFSHIRGSMTSDEFVANVDQIKEMVDQIAQYSSTEAITDVATRLETYTTGIQDTSLEGPALYDLLNDQLLLGLAGVPMKMQCYTDRNNDMFAVAKDCKSGLNTYEDLYKNNFEQAPECDAQVGEYINQVSVKKMVANIAKKESFNPTCELNDKSTKKWVCTYKWDDYDNDEILEEMQELKPDLTMEVVETMSNNCGDPPPKQPSRKQVKKICKLSKKGKDVEVIGDRFDLTVAVVQETIKKKC